MYCSFQVLVVGSANGMALIPILCMGTTKYFFFLESGESKIKFSEAKLRLWESQLSGESSERVTAAEGKSDV